jgi:hypothetical protein
VVGGAIAGLAAAMIGAAVWAGVTIVTEYQIGWMAVAVGFMVGYAVRVGGKGIDSTFGYLGATLALLGCAAGNLFATVGFVANQESASFLDVASRLDLTIIQEIMVATFTPMDLLFYGIAVYEGYKLSFRQLSQEEMAALLPGQ